MIWLLRQLLKTKLGQALAALLGRFTLPGFDKLPMLDVLRFFILGLQKGAIQTRAASMAYNFFLAIFPAILFLFTLIPFIPIRHFQDALFELLRDMMPQNAFSAAQDTLTEILTHHNGKLLSIGFISALYFSTNGFNAMFTAFNKSIHIKDARAPWKQRLIALLFGIVVTLLLVTCISLIVGSEYLMHRLIHRGATLHFLLIAGRMIFIGLLVLTAISLFYTYGPAQRVHWRFINPGALLATLLTLLTSEGFAFYVNHFGSYNKLYGSIGTIIVVMVWIYLNATMLLIGFELNAGIDAARRNRKALEMPEEED